MKTTTHKLDQRSEDWFRLRLGRLTGSRASDMLATIKSGEAAARRDYRTQLVVERLTGSPQEDGFTSKDMQRGVELEPIARAAYEAQTGILVDESGFIASEDYMVGCSVDGHAEDGIVEIKCPKTATHLSYLRNGLPSTYVPQITHNLWVSGAAWCDFVSFDDRLPEHLRLYIVRVPRDEAVIAEYAKKALAFLDEVEREHSLKQNATLWGPVYDQILTQIMSEDYRPDEAREPLETNELKRRVHYGLLAQRFGYVIDLVTKFQVPAKTSSELNTAEMADYLAWLQIYCADELHIQIELPDEMRGAA